MAQKSKLFDCNQIEWGQVGEGEFHGQAALELEGQRILVLLYLEMNEEHTKEVHINVNARSGHSFYLLRTVTANWHAEVAQQVEKMIIALY